MVEAKEEGSHIFTLNTLQDEARDIKDPERSEPVSSAAALAAFAITRDYELRKKLRQYLANQEVFFAPDELKKIEELEGKLEKFCAEYLPATSAESQRESKLEQISIVPEEAQYRDFLKNKIQNQLSAFLEVIKNLAEYPWQNLDAFGLDYWEKLKTIQDFCESLPSPDQTIRHISDLETIYDGDLTNLKLCLQQLEEITNTSIFDNLKAAQDTLSKIVSTKEENSELTRAKLEKEEEKNQINPSRLSMWLYKKTGLVFGRSKRILNDLQNLETQSQMKQQKLQSHQEYATRCLENTKIEQLIPVLQGFSLAIEKAKKTPPQEKTDRQDPADQLVLARTSYEAPLPGKDLPKLQAAGLRDYSARASLHFTLNHLVTSHLEGTWGKEPYVYLIPFRECAEINGKPIYLAAEDTWFFGEINLPPKSLIVAKPNAPLILLPPEQRSGLKIITDPAPYQKGEAMIKQLGYESGISAAYHLIQKHSSALSEYGLRHSPYTHAESRFRRLEGFWADFVQGAVWEKKVEAISAAVRFMELIQDYPHWPQAERVNQNKLESFYQRHQSALLKYLQKINAPSVLNEKMEHLKMELETSGRKLNFRDLEAAQSLKDQLQELNDLNRKLTDMIKK